MADYTIELGVKLSTKDIDTQISSYNKSKNSIKIKADLDPSDITKTLSSYKAAPIRIDTMLNSDGISKAIRAYKPPKKIHLESELSMEGVDKKLSSYIPKKPIKLDVELAKSSINQQIKSANPSEQIKIKAKLDDDAITTAINSYKTSKPISIKINPDFSELNFNKVEELLKGYVARTPLKVDVKLNKTEINKQISDYNQTAQTDAGRQILLKVKITDSAVAEAVSKYNADKLKIPVDLTINPNTEFDAKLKQKIAGYEKTPISIPAKLIPYDKGFSSQIQKVPIPIDVALKNPKALNEAIKTYTGKDIPINAKLVPAKDFDGAITKKPVRVHATLIPDEINQAISYFTPKSKVKVGIELNKQDVNSEISKLPKPTQPLEVDVELTQASINNAIVNVKPASPLKVNVDLQESDINAQIDALRPTSKVKVLLDLDDNINDDIKKQSGQTPINVNVKLDREDINKQIKGFKSTSKITVGVKLDFASHSGGQVGVPQQIKNYKTNNKVKVGVEIDRNSVNQALQGVNVTAPMPIGIELEQTSVQNVRNQIDAIRQEIAALGNIRIDFGVGNSNSGGNGGRRQANETTQAFRELMSVLNELDSKRLQLNRLTASSPQASNEIQTLRLQIEQLSVEYDTLLNTFNANGIRFTGEQWNQIETIMARVGRQINVVQAKMADKSAQQNQTQANAELRKSYKDLLDMANQISGVETKIGQLRITGGHDNQIEVLENKLESLRATYERLVNSFINSGGFNAEIFDIGDFDRLNNAINQSGINVEEFKAKYADLRAELSKKIKTNIDNGDLQGKINAVRQSFNNLGIENEKITNDLTELQRLLNNMDESNDIESVCNDYQTFLQLLKTVKNGVSDLQRQMAEDNRPEILDAKKEAAMQRLNGLFEDGSQASKRFGKDAEKLAKELNACGNVKGVDIVNQKIKNLGTEVKNSHLQTQTLGTRLKEQFSKYSSYFSIASVFMYTAQAMRSMFEQVKLIDSAMTELKKVTNETDESYNKFLTNAASRAKEIGTTIDGLISSTADFARLGYNFADSQGLAEVANIYAVVGDEIEGVEDATESLISTMAAFKDEAQGVSNTDFAMGIIDRFNEIGNKFAISSGGIGEALKRSASSLDAANNSIDESIALITAANTVVQNPDKVGRLLPTIKMAISVKLQRWTRPRKDFISIFGIRQLGRAYIFYAF